MTFKFQPGDSQMLKGPLRLAMGAIVIASAFAASPAFAATPLKIDAADTAWMICATA